MRRFWLLLLSLGLVMAFSASVFAADVKFTGSYFVVGMYQDDTSFLKDESNNPSTAFYYQRLRVRADVLVSPGLKLVTRFDAMERSWGAPRSSGIVDFTAIVDSAGSRSENENIAFDWVYIEYASRLGVFTVGYQEDMAWGTKFGDWSRPAGKIAWSYATKGGLTLMADVAKLLELSRSVAMPVAFWNDGDIDKYSVAAKYAWNKGEAGLKFAYLRSAALRSIGPQGTTNLYGVIPYAKAKVGPVALEAEIDYYWGDLLKFDDGSGKVKLDSLGVYVDALADLGMFYVGGTVAYLSGDKDLLDDDKLQIMVGGKDWMPCLLLFNFDRTYWAGPIDGVIPEFGIMYNAWFYQLRAGVRPVADLDLGVSLSYAKADKRIFNMPKKDYGWELDVTANYKITNNLFYMLGVGYLWTGDYYKQNSDDKLKNNYLVINKLTLTF